MNMGYEIEFYESENGQNPVNDFINSLNEKQIAKVLREIDLLEQFGSELHFPHTDTIKGEKYKGLEELRIKFSSDIFRIFYFVVIKNKCVLLHGIQKKSDRTPNRELETALNRMKDYKARF